MKRILVLDGGGVKGLMQLVVLAEIERVTGKRIARIFDLIVGSSVGAILGALMAQGSISAARALDIMHRVIPEMFRRQWVPPFPKYSRRPFVRAWKHLMGADYFMGELPVMYMCTAVNICDGRTHFFKSWESKDGELQVLDAVLRSFAAPAYFGALRDDRGLAVWIDGGCGNSNCPIQETVIEALRQGWLGKEALHILSLGTGLVDRSETFQEACRFRTLRQCLYFADPADGGLARNQMVESLVAAAGALRGLVPDYTFQRLDAAISKEMDCLDGVRFMDSYVETGRNMAKMVNFDLLK